MNEAKLGVLNGKSRILGLTKGQQSRTIYTNSPTFRQPRGGYLCNGPRTLWRTTHDNFVERAGEYLSWYRAVAVVPHVLYVDHRPIQHQPNIGPKKAIRNRTASIWSRMEGVGMKPTWTFPSPLHSSRGCGNSQAKHVGSDISVPAFPVVQIQALFPTDWLDHDCLESIDS